MHNKLFEICYLVGFIVGSIIRGRYTRPYRNEVVAEDRRSVLEIVLLIPTSCGLMIVPLIYVFSPWLDFADFRLPAGAGMAAGTVGAVVFAGALWLLWRSHVDLGRHWTLVPQIRPEHTLVTEGVFRRIRHPMYAAHWLWGIAQALLLHNWIAGPALLAAFLPFYFVRVSGEERMMLDHFGDDYRAYMKRTGRVVPRFRI